MSDTSTLRTTERRLWFAGDRVLGLALTVVIVGGVVSTIVTVEVAVLVLPASSLAVKVTVVVPNGNAPGALLVIVALSSQLSVAVGSATVTGVPAKLVCSAVIGAGT